jgi:hypothetical protein
MKVVGRSGACLSPPGKGVPVGSTCLRIARSIKRQNSSANNEAQGCAACRLLQKPTSDKHRGLQKSVLLLRPVLVLVHGEDGTGAMGQGPRCGPMGAQDEAARLFLQVCDHGVNSLKINGLIS